MNRVLMVSSVFALVLASVLMAKPGTVFTKSGQHYDGDVTEKDDNVIVNNGKIEIQIKKSNIDHVDFFESVEDQFNARLKKLDKKDVKGRVELAKWASDKHDYKLARVALREAMDIDPNDPDATALNDTIGRQMELENKRVESTGEEPTTRGAATQANGDRRVLKPSDINIIKQKELKPNDTGVHIRFENGVENRFANATNRDIGRFHNLKQMDKFIEMAKENDPKFLEDAKIVGDPSVIVDFRRDVQRTILTGCATSVCHGGPNPGKFALISPADNDASTYTNFYVLETYRQQMKAGQGKERDSGGIFGTTSAERSMINRSHPDDSVLLSYGLPADISEFDHPDVQGYRGLFKSRNDPRYKTIAAWMHSLKPIDPDYGIDFNPGGGETAPATRPTAAPPATRP